MKKFSIILIMVFITLKLFAPYVAQDWDKIIKEYFFYKEQQFYKILAIEIKSVETWHDTLNYKRGDPYKKVNQIGAMGAYQFMPKTLRWLGYKGTFIFFLNSPELQDYYMLKLLKINKSTLEKQSFTYKIVPMDFIGFKIKGVEITLSGLLAASHLGGVGSVQKFLATNHNARDLNKTSIKCYLDKFKNITT